VLQEESGVALGQHVQELFVQDECGRHRYLKLVDEASSYYLLVYEALSY
jgi:hypothetical protein